jgi:hypothetical protein
VKFSDSSDKKWIALADQQTTSVRVYDLDEGTCREGSEVWHFHAPWKNKFQDIRLRMLNGREVLAAACDGGYACIIDIETKKVLWSTHECADNPHSIELLPCGIIAVGSTTGQALHFFDVHSEHPSRSTARYAPHDFHGLLYDPETDRLWAWGNSTLHLLKTERTEGGIRCHVEALYHCDTRWGHDLQPVAGSFGRKLWLTNHPHVLQFDTVTRTFSVDYPGAEVISAKNTKAIGSYADGTVISMAEDGGFFPWTSYTVRVFTPTEDGFIRRDIPLPGRASYKCRAWTANYYG